MFNAARLASSLNTRGLHRSVRRREGCGRRDAIAMEFHRVIRAAKADPATPEEAVDQTVHILTTNHRDDTDTSPLQFVSNEQLAYYRAIEAAMVTLLAALGALAPPDE